MYEQLLEHFGHQPPGNHHTLHVELSWDEGHLQ